MTSQATAGPETRINTTAGGNQQYSSIASLADGGWVVTWESNGQDERGYYGVYQQRYAADGRRIGSETQVNSYLNVYGEHSSVAALDNGGWVVTWETGQLNSNNQRGIYQQRYDADGDKAGSETLVNTYTLGYLLEGSLSVTALAHGGSVVTWSSYDADGTGIYQQRCDANGDPVGSETVVNTYTAGTQQLQSPAALADGGWVVAWTSYAQDGSNNGVYLQRYNADGNKVGIETLVNAYVTGSQSNPSVAAFANGGWVVTWESDGQDGDGEGIYQQRYAANGHALGSENRVNTTTALNQFESSVATLADGGWVVTWQSLGQEGGNTYGIYQQRYDANGAKVGSEVHEAGSETQVNTYTNGNQLDSSVTALANGGWVVTWMSDGQDGSGYGIYQRHYAPDIRGTAHADKLVGTSWGEYLVGYGGNDTLDGKGGADVMVGGKGNDTYVVGNKNDEVQELSGQGTDLVKASVSYTLDSNIENLTLTGSGNTDGKGNGLANILTGNSGKNSLSGGNGNDRLSGGSGNDTLGGGGGNDILTGGYGRDLLTGGAGADHFVFAFTRHSGTTALTRDVIKDFVHGTDKIDLHSIDANTASSSDQAFALDARSSATAAVARGHIGWYQENHAGTANDVTILRLNVDSDAAIEMTIELHGLVSLTKGDFLL